MNRKSQDDCPDFEPEIRLLALQADPLGNLAARPGNTWTRLMSGSWKVVGTFSTDDRYYLVTVVSGNAESGDHTDASCMKMLEDIILTGSQKVVALKRGVSPSTVTSRARQALGSIGVSVAPSHIPPIILMLVHAAHRDVPLMSAREGSFYYRERLYHVSSTPRLELGMHCPQPPAERAVLRMLVEGHAYAHIARTRRASVRTVANQVSASFRRLQVSGRADLVRLLLEQGALARSEAHAAEP